MSTVRSLIDDLRSKPLLMLVALALLAALIAIPLFLAKPVKTSAGQTALPAPAPSTDAATSAFADVTNLQPAVTDQQPFYQQNGKRVRLFPRKNPFRSRAPATPASTAGQAGTPPPGSGTASTGSGTSIVPTSTGTSGSGTSQPVYYYRYTAKVKFGKQGDKLNQRTLNGFTSLPSSNDPIVVFLGIRSDGTTAVFLLSSSATTTGDGACQPSADECAFIYMTKGNSQTIEAVSSDSTVTTYVLKLTGVGVKKVSQPQASSSSRAKPEPRRAARPAKARKQQLRKAKRQRKRAQKRLVGVLDSIGF